MVITHYSLDSHLELIPSVCGRDIGKGRGWIRVSRLTRGQVRISFSVPWVASDDWFI